MHSLHIQLINSLWYLYRSPKIHSYVVRTLIFSDVGDEMELHLFSVNVVEVWYDRQGRPCGAGGLRRHSKRGPIVYKFFLRVVGLEGPIF